MILKIVILRTEIVKNINIVPENSSPTLSKYHSIGLQYSY